MKAVEWIGPGAENPPVFFLCVARKMGKPATDEWSSATADEFTTEGSARGMIRALKIPEAHCRVVPYPKGLKPEKDDGK